MDKDKRIAELEMDLDAAYGALADNRNRLFAAEAKLGMVGEWCAHSSYIDDYGNVFVDGDDVKRLKDILSDQPEVQ